jgi:hypothetical protein
MTRIYHRGRALPVTCLWATLLLIALAPSAQAEVKVGDLTVVDKQHMQGLRTTLDDLARRHFGRQFNGDTDNDLALLQSLLDSSLVRADQTPELQGMGIVLGDRLAEDLGMHWVVYEDEYGRSRALRYRDSDNYLFPVTMISRRREAGNDTSVRAIYQKAYDIIAPLRQTLPFQ